MGVFEAITLHAAGQSNEAIASLLELMVDFVRTPDIERYKLAISGNAARIRSLGGNGKVALRMTGNAAIGVAGRQRGAVGSGPP